MVEVVINRLENSCKTILYEIIIQKMIATVRTQELTTHKIHSIQVLRGIAALIVVCVHASITLDQYRWPALLAPMLGKLGHLGVDIFFVISGFLMVGNTIDKAPGFNSAKIFMQSRLQRIVPLYWVLTTALALILFLFPSLFHQQKFISANVFLSYLFIPSLDSFGVVNPVLYVGWTLVYEMFFYVVFSFLLCFTRRYIVHLMAFIFISLALLGLLGSENILIKTYTNSLILEFIFGCAVAQFYFFSTMTSKFIAFGALIGGVSLLLIFGLYTSYLPRFVYFGIPATLLMTGCILLEKNNIWPKWRFFHRLGDISYSLYLSHIFVLPVLGRIILKPTFFQEMPTDILFIFMLSCCCAVGYAVYIFIERPIIRFFHFYSRPGNQGLFSYPTRKNMN